VHIAWWTDKAGDPSLPQGWIAEYHRPALSLFGDSLSSLNLVVLNEAGFPSPSIRLEDVSVPIVPSESIGPDDPLSG